MRRRRTPALDMLRHHKSWLLKEIGKADESESEESPLRQELLGRYNAFLREEKKILKKK